MSQYKITAVCTLGITKDEAQEIAKGIELFSGVKYALSEEIRPTLFPPDECPLGGRHEWSSSIPVCLKCGTRR